MIEINNYAGTFTPERRVLLFCLCLSSGDEDGKNVPPNSTIMVRGLAQHISENDIRADILSYGLQAKDIRLIRKKETGKF